MAYSENYMRLDLRENLPCFIQNIISDRKGGGGGGSYQGNATIPTPLHIQRKPFLHSAPNAPPEIPEIAF